MWHVTCSSRPPTLSQRHMCGHTRDVVIYSMFHQNPFRALGNSVVEICQAFPLIWLWAFTTACSRLPHKPWQLVPTVVQQLTRFWLTQRVALLVCSSRDSSQFSDVNAARGLQRTCRLFCPKTDTPGFVDSVVSWFRAVSLAEVGCAFRVALSLNSTDCFISRSITLVTDGDHCTVDFTANSHSYYY